MPKISDNKKQKSPKQVEKLILQKPVEPKAVEKDVDFAKIRVYRLFECVVHLEEALAQLKQVGIFPGGESDAKRYQASHQHAVTTVECLYKDYLVQWGAMLKP